MKHSNWLERIAGVCLVATLLGCGGPASGDGGTDTGTAGDEGTRDTGVGPDEGARDTGGGGMDEGVADTGGGMDAGADAGSSDTGGGGDAGGTDAVEVDAIGTRGCASPGGAMCPTGLMCCSGVPYPTEGVCMLRCDRVSDRALKERIVPVDPDRVLERLARMPVAEWSYRGDAPGVRHMGPMAQDFRAAFGLGATDREIHSLDADGVAFAALQALTRRVEALARENAELRQRLDRLEPARTRARAARR